MNVLVIPEDFRKDQYVLLPLVEALLAAAGKARARVRVCIDPLLGSVDQALSWARIREIIDRYPMVDLFLVCVDRDGEEGRRESLDRLESEAEKILGAGRKLFGENAWQELEVWLLAGHDLPAKWSWKKIRREPHPKETYFLPFAEAQGVLEEPAEGRKTLARQAAARYPRIRQLCPEDVAVLEQRIRDWLESDS